jgi:hypothetical protein
MRPFIVGQVTRISQFAAVVTSAVLRRPHRWCPLESGHHFESQTIQRIQNVFGRTLRIGNSDFRPFEFFGASNYFQVDLDHDGVYIEPGKEEKLVARFKSPVSAPLCEYIKGQPFFEELKEMKESNTVGEAVTSVYAKMACAVGLHETSFSSSREFYFRPLNCSEFGDILANCMTTEMLKAIGKRN